LFGDGRWCPNVVMAGLVPAIQPSACSGARGEMDPRDKPEDDKRRAEWPAEDVAMGVFDGALIPAFQTWVIILPLLP
jgi:hypothetical protein